MKREKNSLHIGTGIPVILLIFVSLAMVILSSLIFLQVMQEHTIFDRQIAFEVGYHQANAKAEYVLDCLRSGNTENLDVEIKTEEEGYSYVIDAGQGRQLFVLLNKNHEVLEWRIES